MATDLWPSVPQEILIQTEQKETCYKRQPDYYALYGCLPADNHDQVVTSLNQGAILVLKGAPQQEQIPITCPIFSLEPSRMLAVATGKVFIRFEEDIAALDYTGDVEQLGYEIEECPIYAPHALWLRPKSGIVADGLGHAKDLRQLPHIANVEPQMLVERKLRV
jgi:hypothetical protein